MNNGTDFSQADSVAEQQIGQFLLDNQLILRHDLEFALEHRKYSNQPLGALLVRMGALSQHDLEKVLKGQGANAAPESEVLPPIFVFS